jgi:hypothetical protein
MLSLVLRQARKTHLDFGPCLDAENKPKRTPSALHRRLCSHASDNQRAHSGYLIFSPFFLIYDGAESCKYCGITAAGTSPPSEGSNTAIV